MKKIDNILKTGRFAVPDNDFSDQVMQRIARQQDSQPMVVRRLSTWREFRLPMIGVAVGVLLFGLIVTRIVDFGSWVDNFGTRYIETSKILADKLTPHFSLPSETDQSTEQKDNNNEEAIPRGGSKN
ncbi:MAG: hypothetical protein RR980_02670 [Mucinivorans sp.]